ncbi:MAG TPA: Gfo/Idh/MocA family oxidoreductase [Steroidobacteraceae bacterium]|nr:Gfo/Idh/MocA family oxidoreductase [Steroidobacteraceae bacterium]
MQSHPRSPPYLPHGIPGAFGSWSEMLASNTVDAVYVATPTSVREEVCLLAAANGKHVLGEKPFANLPSLRRITSACRKNGVGFMPYGAIGDAGWYNMRAAVEYTAPGVKVVGADAYVRRDKRSKAVITGSGVIAFSDGSTNTWNCGFESGAANMDLRISGPAGQISLHDFVFIPGDGAPEYEYRKGGFGAGPRR